MLSLLIKTMLVSGGGFRAPGELPSPIKSCNPPQRGFLSHTKGVATRGPAKAVAGVQATMRIHLTLGNHALRKA